MARSNLTPSELSMLKSAGLDPQPPQSGLTAAEASMAQGEDPKRQSFARIKNNDTPQPQAMIGVEKQKGNPNPSGI